MDAESAPSLHASVSNECPFSFSSANTMVTHPNAEGNIKLTFIRMIFSNTDLLVGSVRAIMQNGIDYHHLISLTLRVLH